MDELIDILDSNGKFIGKVEYKSHAHRMGLFHATVHVWFYSSDGNVLLQRRGKNKDIHPLLWDVSVAGHIGAGEEIITSALREIEEEIGLQVSENDLEKIGIFKSRQKHRDDLIDCEFHHTFLCKLEVSIEDLRKQDSEVEALKLIQLDQFSNDISDSNSCKSHVPHEAFYYNTIISAIQERL